MSTALLFPGQGSQKVGMGVDLAEQFRPARQCFEEASEALGEDLLELCRNGPSESLALTANAQPAILTTSIAALRALTSEHELQYEWCAGHSLGEFSALVAVGALPFADAVRLVRIRGTAMQAAVPPGKGAMAALLGADLESSRALCASVAQDHEVCQPANLNGGGQVVISGHATAIERAVARASEFGVKKAMLLDVSAPFHCSLMAPAAQALKVALDAISIHPMSAPVVANVTAEPNRDPAKVAPLLIEQVTGTVRWEETMRNLVRDGVTSAVELGFGTVLRGLARRIVSELPVNSVGSCADIATWSQ